MIEFTKRTIKKIIVSLVIFMTITNYIMPKFVFADDDESDGGGGVLLQPLFDLITVLDDAVLSTLQGNFIINEPITIDAEVPGKVPWKSIGLFILGAGAVVGSVLLAPVTAGASTAIAALVTNVLAKVAVAGVVTTLVATYTRNRFYKRRL